MSGELRNKIELKKFDRCANLMLRNSRFDRCANSRFDPDGICCCAIQDLIAVRIQDLIAVRIRNLIAARIKDLILTEFVAAQFKI